MLSGKKRSYLRSMANGIKPTTQIGKDGISEEFLTQLDEQLKAREIVKVTILDNAGLDARESANAVCNAIRAEFVQAIGNKFTIYKKNNENPKITFPGHGPAKAKNKRDEVSSNRITKRMANENENKNR
ncbi:YhbY family RNA-binding protein [Peptostreptococcus faecalis]|uniref:YhbY family RNA-binding protein n=1 Tax=Peptostreptococcus faecalis TaxID=2045015 RepID=UPI000C7AC8C7|nr:YhbY family RNA-binding protein [Peptostreptococcus faecalis]